MTQGEPGPGPLAGLLVADFSHVLSGPYATMALGDLGADVIRIERPGHGDQTRGWGPPYFDDESAYFLSVNRNKRSVVLDLQTTAGRAAAASLVDRADILVQNFRPGVMEDLGLDYATVAERNPGLIYCSISAFGTTAAAATLPGYDLLVQAASGLMSITGTEDGEPVKVGVAVADVIAGLNLATAALAALHHRGRTGCGQHVEVDLFSSMLAGLVNQASTYLTGGGVPQPMGMRHPSITPYECFRTATRPVIIAAGTDRQFATLARVLRVADLADDERFVNNQARVAHRAALVDLLEERCLTWDADDLVAELSAAAVPCGLINSIDEAFELGHALGLDPTLVIPRFAGAAVPQVASPIRMSASPVSYRFPPPRLGEHTDEVLAEVEAGRG